MPSIQGNLMSTSPGRFVARFQIDLLLYALTGAFSTVVPPITIPVTLTYDDLDQLTNMMPFEGTFGINTIEFDLPNGPEIVGDLPASVAPKIEVQMAGVGSWIKTEC
ncbi:hypothetical protein B0H34DRAFT_256535 [Crassisporium funariophilum]|nr:hypothetical protein B0H34DRAFT_256535 [Crassisporium funariophilum]